jgi:DHA1 family multidrug resistance protein-like MFS transporter
MLKKIGRNNQLYMVANFLFAFGTGLWLNLRPLYLADLGAAPQQIGLALAIGGLSAGLLPIPAGIISDRFGPRRVILYSWLAAFLGALLSALAPTWQLATLGIVVWSLTMAANPAVTAFVFLSMPPALRDENLEKAFSWVFRVWPFAMLFAPAVGGWIANLWGIRVDLWIGGAVYLLAMFVFSFTVEVRAENMTAKFQLAGLHKNRNYWILALFFTILVLVQQIGYSLLPNFLEEAGGFTQAKIGLLFSVSFLGAFLGNILIARVQPRTGFILLLLATWAGMVLMLGPTRPFLAGIAFFLFGGITTMWLIKAACSGRAVSAEQQGVAFGLMESLGFLATSAAAGIAGVLYGITPTHTLPLLVSSIGIPLVFVGWMLIVQPLTGEPLYIARRQGKVSVTGNATHPANHPSGV